MHKNIIGTAVLTFALAVFAQVSFSQTPDEGQKAKLVGELVEFTFKAFPVDAFQGTIEEMKNGSLRGFKSEITKTLNAKVDESSDVPAAKKAEIKAKIPNLVDKMTARVEVLVTQDLDIEQWIKDTLT